MSQSQHTELLGLSIQQLTELIESTGEAGFRARQLFDGLYRQRWGTLERFSTLPLKFRQRLADEGFRVGLPGTEKKFVSSDGTARYLLAFGDGQSVETVWMPEGDGGEAGDGSDSGDDELEQLSDAANRRSLGFARDDRDPSSLGMTNLKIGMINRRFEMMDPWLGMTTRRAGGSEPRFAFPARWGARSNAPSA